LALPSAFFKEHRASFVAENDFDFLSRHGINTLRIPVGRWITQDPYPLSPFIGGSLAALDNHLCGKECLVSKLLFTVFNTHDLP
jgi:hypothetical protein